MILKVRPVRLRQAIYEPADSPVPSAASKVLAKLI
jgi:hypothetical protein